jgi:hypothetical protein
MLADVNTANNMLKLTPITAANAKYQSRMVLSVISAPRQARNRLMAKGAKMMTQPTTPENRTGTSPIAFTSAAATRVAATPPTIRTNTPATAVFKLSAALRLVFIFVFLLVDKCFVENTGIPLFVGKSM